MRAVVAVVSVDRSAKTKLSFCSANKHGWMDGYHSLTAGHYDDDDDDDESIGYVRPLLQLKTVTSVLMIRSDEEFGFQITTE